MQLHKYSNQKSEINVTYGSQKYLKMFVLRNVYTHIHLCVCKLKASYLHLHLLIRKIHFFHSKMQPCAALQTRK